MKIKKRIFLEKLTELAYDVIEKKRSIRNAIQTSHQMVKHNVSFKLSWLIAINIHSMKLESRNPDIACIIAEINYNLARLTKDHTVISSCASNYSIRLKKVGMLKQALNTMKLARMYYRKLNKLYDVIFLTLQIGSINQKLGEMKKARYQFRQAHKMARYIDNISEKIKIFYMLGLVFEIFETLPDVYLSIKYCKVALNLAEENNDSKSCFDIAENLTRLHYQLDDKETAIIYCRRVIKYTELLDDYQSKAIFTRQLGLFYYNLGDNNNAILYFTQAHEDAQQLKDRNLQIRALLGIGMAQAASTNIETAFSIYKKILLQAQNSQNHFLEQTILSTIASTYMQLGRPEKALRFDWDAYYLADKHNETKLKNLSLVNIANSEIDLGNPVDAIARLKKQLANFEKQNSISASLGYRFNGTIARAYLEMGNVILAQQHFQKALTFARRLHKAYPLPTLLTNYGLTYQNSNKVFFALQAYEEAVGIARKHNDIHAEAKIFSYIGELYLSYGDIRKAKEAYYFSLTHYRKARNRRGILTALLQFANISIEMDMKDETEQFLKKIIRIAQKWNNRSSEMQALGALGALVLEYKDEPEKALLHLNKAADIAGELKNSGTEIKLRNKIAIGLNRLGMHEKALKILKVQVETAQRLGDKQEEMYICFNKATIYTELKNYFDAYKYISRAIEISEQLRTEGHLESHKMHYMKQSEQMYYVAINICLELSKNKEALEYLEKIKSRVLAEQISLHQHSFGDNNARPQNLI
ncbi:MAG: hypothetical protein DWQ10_07635 [Calditrichaeota bacterium]|nr:MAG: hypothetical protein DWQ10_07635 [Calditrichota bacterium]